MVIFAYKLYRIKDTVILRILLQKESTRGNKNLDFISSNGFVIVSRVYCELRPLGEKIIFIGGLRGRNRDIAYRKYHDEEEAELAESLFLVALEEFGSFINGDPDGS